MGYRRVGYTEQLWYILRYLVVERRYKMKILVYAVVVAALLAVSFFGTAGLVWVVCWAFKLTWSWKISLGVWAALILISGAVKSTGGKK